MDNSKYPRFLHSVTEKLSEEYLSNIDFILPYEHIYHNRYKLWNVTKILHNNTIKSNNFII